MTNQEILELIEMLEKLEQAFLLAPVKKKGEFVAPADVEAKPEKAVTEEAEKTKKEDKTSQKNKTKARKGPNKMLTAAIVAVCTVWGYLSPQPEVGYFLWTFFGVPRLLLHLKTR